MSRLAPSPTGALHLGNARTFLVNWALARQQGWRLLLRVDDLDGPRVKPHAEAQAIDDMRWLGLDWDTGPTRQTDRVDTYAQALARLRDRGLLYPCRCTRREIEAAQSAPHAEDHDLRYPGICRPTTPSGAVTGTPEINPNHPAMPGRPETGLHMAWPSSDVALRLIVPEGDIRFEDRFAGWQAFDVQATVGDFVVATKQGLAAYQLAVTVDDAADGVTDVVRGDDLLASTARQILLYRMLDLPAPDRWWHLPLVVGPDGRRLAKRHGDTRLAWYRERGVPAERLVGLLASWCGIDGPRRPMSAQAFSAAFDPDRLPAGPTTFTPEDHAWLLS